MKISNSVRKMTYICNSMSKSNILIFTSSMNSFTFGNFFETVTQLLFSLCLFDLFKRSNHAIRKSFEIATPSFTFHNWASTIFNETFNFSMFLNKCFGAFHISCFGWNVQLLKNVNHFIYKVFTFIWKSPKMSHLSCWILAFSTNFGPIKTDLSGNTVWPQASGFQKLVKMDHFVAFLINFCPLKM